jgi:hypothetical protein
VCSDNYFLSSGKCQACSGGGVFTPSVIIYVIGGLLFTVAFVYLKFGHVFTATQSTLEVRVRRWFDKIHSTLMVNLKVIVSTYQIVGSTANSLSISMPQHFSSFTKALNFMSFNFSDTFAMDCHYENTFIDDLLFNTLLPIGGSILIGLCFCMEWLYLTCKLSRRNPGSASSSDAAPSDSREATLDGIKNKYLNLFFYLTYFGKKEITLLFIKYLHAFLLIVCLGSLVMRSVARSIDTNFSGM